ncbi:MAG: 50S ribosome-binding GTPase [Clostridiales Family XIII bacterium]|jgi:uncharacterized protein (DUF697 family)/GTP-binding protein EngB required for normal cell division|nr:50S ribosome-binding GTPase [Clostridiales Family XIII bacterium]
MSNSVSFNWQDLAKLFIQDINLGDLADDFNKKYTEEVARMGNVNIIVAGRTGVGKSSLINAAFRENIAETGLGNPVTPKIQMIEKPGVPVKIYDTVGLELNKDTQSAAIRDIKDLIAEKSKSNDIREMIHLVWYCISVESERFEDVEERFVEAIAGSNVPVVMVTTKSFDKALTDRFVSDLNNRNLPIKKVIPVLAHNKLEYKAYGVEELVEYSVSLLPETVKGAWINAVKDVKMKKNKAQAIVTATVAGNFAIGFIPIPFADAGVLAAAEVAMLGSIAAVYGLKLDKNELVGFVSALAGVGGAAVLGRTIVGNLIKLIPGAGTLVGGAISGTTAAILTFALGEAFIAAMDMIAANNINEYEINSKEVMKKIKNVFKSSLKLGKKKFKGGVPTPDEFV